MTSQQAFEAHITKQFGSYRGLSTSQQLIGWQAAIEWASKQAIEACDNINYSVIVQKGW